MMEKEYRFTVSDSGMTEKVVDDERVAINHIVVAPGGSVPVHVTNSHVHQIVVRGVLSLSLEDGPIHDHPRGSIIAIPFNRKMSVRNRGEEPLELFVVKAPNPRSMPAVKEI